MSQPWIHSTSCALSQGRHLALRVAPRRVCLGKHLRARKLKPQAKPKSKRKRTRKPPLNWGKQAAARFRAFMLAGWPRRLAQCAQELATFCCVNLLPKVVLLLRSSADKYATRNACPTACPDPTDFSSRLAQPQKHCAVRLAKHCTSPPLPLGVRPSSPALLLGEHHWILGLGPTALPHSRLPLSFLSSAVMDPSST